MNNIQKFNNSLQQITYSLNKCVSFISKEIDYQKIVDDCIKIKSNKRIHFKRIFKVFKKEFPSEFHSIDAIHTKQDKEYARQIMNQLLSTFPQNEDSVQKLEKIVNNPRIMEIYLNGKELSYKPIRNGNIHKVYEIFDREKKPIAIFKLCQKNSRDALSEEEISQTLRKMTKINQKTSNYIYLNIDNSRVGGIFQKYVQGFTFYEIFNHLKLLNSKQIQDLHYIAIFDLLNHNHDRHINNMMLDHKGKVWAIDNALGQGPAWNFGTIWKVFATDGRVDFNKPLSQHIRQFLIHIEPKEILSNNLDFKKRAKSLFYLRFMKWAAQQGKNCPTLGQLFSLLEASEKIKDKPRHESDYRSITYGQIFHLLILASTIHNS